MLHRTALLTLAVLLFLPACKDANTKICLDDFKKFEEAVASESNEAQQLAGGVYQSCGISCDIVKDKDACAAFKSVSEMICEKEGKEACEVLCGEGETKNEYACAALGKL